MLAKWGSTILLVTILVFTATGTSAEEIVVARPGAEEVLSLEACVVQALETNDLLNAERMRRRELDGQMKQALSTGLPTLDASGTWMRSRDPSFALDSSFGGGGDTSFGSTALDSLFSGFSFLPAPEDIPAQTYWRTSLNLHWELNPVRLMGAVGAAGAGIDRQNQAIIAVTQQTEESVIQAYHGIILAHEQLASSKANLATQRELLEIMNLRFERGMATELDTLQAAVAVANIEPQVRLARQGLQIAGSILNAVMGREPDMPVSVFCEQPVELDPVDRDLALRMAIDRPDIRQMNHVSELLKQNRKAQKANLMPYFSSDASYGLVGRTVSDLNETGHDFWSASVSLNVPIFDGLLHRGSMQQTGASIRRNEADISGMKRAVRVEVLDLLSRLDAARQNLSAADLNMTRSEDLLETSKMMLRVGKTDYLTVLDAEANRSLANTNLIQARYDVLTLTASLKRAIGVSPMRPLTSVEGLVKGKNNDS